MKIETASADGVPALIEPTRGRSRRIAVCVEGGQFGGLERFVLMHANHVRGVMGMELVVFAFFDGPLARQLRENSVPVVVLTRRSKYSLGAIVELRRAFMGWGVDLVHTHGYRATILGALAARLCGLPVVKTEHGVVEPQTGWSGLKLRVNYMLADSVTRCCVDRVVYVTRDLRNHYRGRDGVVIHNGILSEGARSRVRPSELEGADFQLGVVGRLVPVKGHRVLLEALARCRNRARIQLHVLGAGPLERELRERARDYGLERQVRFHGFRTDVGDYVGWLDAVAMPSLHEGLPYALLEAMAFKKPIIASRVGGLAEALEDGKNGLLCAPGDSVELARLIDRLVEDDGLREKLAAGAYSRVVKDFGFSDMIARYVLVYEEARRKRGAVEWVSWDAHRRTLELARALGIALRVIRRGRTAGLRRPIAWLRSLGPLLSTRSRVLLVQNPSVILTVTTLGLAPLKRYRVVQDLHSYFYQTLEKPVNLREHVYGWLSRYCLRKSDLTIVTNAFLCETVERLGGRGFILQDKIPNIQDPGRIRLAGRFNLVFICTYSPDEPIDELLQAARLIPDDVVIHITGRPPRAAARWSIPRNIRLTGYLPEEGYLRLLSSADAVLALTTREHTLLCAAYEAIALGKPLVMSDKRALRDYFRKGVVFTMNDHRSLAASMQEVERNLDTLRREIAALKHELSEAWEIRFADLREAVNGLTGLPGRDRPGTSSASWEEQNRG